MTQNSTDWGGVAAIVSAIFGGSGLIASAIKWLVPRSQLDDMRDQRDAALAEIETKWKPETEALRQRIWELRLAAAEAKAMAEAAAQVAAKQEGSS